MILFLSRLSVSQNSNLQSRKICYKIACLDTRVVPWIHARLRTIHAPLRMRQFRTPKFSFSQHYVPPRLVPCTLCMRQNLESTVEHLVWKQSYYTNPCTNSASSNLVEHFIFKQLDVLCIIRSTFLW
jgi:deoxycytidylate deaminase